MARGLGNIRSTPANLIEEAFAKADGPKIDALVHIGTGLPVLGLVEKLKGSIRNQ